MAISYADGYFSGKVGNNVYRRVNGKTIISALPQKSTKPPTEIAIIQRNRFRFCIKLGDAIMSLYPLAYFWKQITPRNRATRNVLLKHLFSRVSSNLESKNINLFPNPDFVLGLNEVVIERSRILLHTKPFPNNTEIYPPQEPFISAHGVLCLKNTDLEAKERYTFIPFSFEDKEIIINQELDFEVELSKLQTELFDKYPDRTLIVNFTTKNLAREPRHISLTCMV